MVFVKNNKRILLTANTGWYFFNFRLGFLERLRSHGYSVTLLCPCDTYSEKLKALGFEHIEFSLDRSGMNPAAEFYTLVRLVKAIRLAKPEILHNHTVKFTLYGTLAGRLLGVPTIVNSITGLGHLFLSHSAKALIARKLVMWLYRGFGSVNTKFIFQNFADQTVFFKYGIKKSVLIEGSGVNTERFKPSVLSDSCVRILFASRLLREKGIFELVEACRMLRSKGLAFRLRVAGSIDQGNPSSVLPGEVAAWQREGIVEWLGHLDPIDQELAASHIVALPSWREGFSRILLEAFAAGKAVVTTDAPGCADLVIDGENGLISPVRNFHALAEKLSLLIEDVDLRERLGKAARKHVEHHFDDATVFRKTLAVYDGAAEGLRRFS